MLIINHVGKRFDFSKVSNSLYWRQSKPFKLLIRKPFKLTIVDILTR